MFRSIFTVVNRLRIGRCCALGALAACLALAGCTSLNLRGEGARETEMSRWTRQFRQSDHSRLPSAVTNQGRQIEGDFGIH
jgi:hypothetical protein